MFIEIETYKLVRGQTYSSGLLIDLGCTTELININLIKSVKPQTFGYKETKQVGLTVKDTYTSEKGCIVVASNGSYCLLETYGDFKKRLMVAASAALDLSHRGKKICPHCLNTDSRSENDLSGCKECSK